ncbi:MAG: NUDIX hydrolase [Acidimicrobiia bacterium]
MAPAFEVVARRRLAHGSFVDFEQWEVAAPDGSKILRDVVRHPGAVAMVPLEGDDIVLIRQYRAAVDRHMLEIPAGKLETGEDRRTTAARELVEEIGYHPQRLTEIASYFATPGFCDEHLTVYLAEELQPRPAAPHGAEEQVAEIVAMPLAEAHAMAMRGEFDDAKTLIGVLLAVRLRT